MTLPFSDNPRPTRFNILLGNMTPNFWRCSEPTFHNRPPMRAVQKAKYAQCSSGNQGNNTIGRTEGK